MLVGASPQLGTSYTGDGTNKVRQEPQPTAEHVTDSGTDDRPARKGLHAYVSEEAYLGWHEFAASHRVTVSAMIEVFGRGLGNRVDSEDVDLEDALQEVVRIAARIDRERRSRSRD